VWLGELEAKQALATRASSADHGGLLVAFLGSVKYSSMFTSALSGCAPPAPQRAARRREQ
jgi:hypothetical protein